MTSRFLYYFLFIFFYFSLIKCEKTSNFTKINLQYEDNKYTSAILIGKNEQTYKITFDTISSYLQIPSNNCTNCLYDQTYDCKLEKTCTQSEKLKISQYLRLGKTDVMGFTIKDTVIYTSLIKIINQPILLVLQEVNTGYRSEGICGLNYKDIRNDEPNSLISNLKKQKIISNKIFSFYFDPDKYSTASGTANSMLILGGYDENLYNLPLISLPQIDSDNWAIRLNTFSLDKNILYEGNTKMLINTADSLIYAPFEIYSKILIYLKNSFNACATIGTYIKCSCPDGLNLFPNLEFKFGDKEKLILDPKFYIEEQNLICIIHIGSNNNELSDFWILGNSFLKKYYSIFDAEENNISFGIAKNRDDKFNIVYSDAIIVGLMILCSVVLGFSIIWYVNKKTGFKNIEEENNLRNLK